MDYSTPNGPSCIYPFCIFEFWKSNFLVCGILSISSLLDDDVLVLPLLQLSASECLLRLSTFEVPKGGNEITHTLRKSFLEYPVLTPTLALTKQEDDRQYDPEAAQTNTYREPSIIVAMAYAMWMRSLRLTCVPRTSEAPQHVFIIMVDMYFHGSCDTQSNRN